MAIKDLVPWNNRNREVGFSRGTDVHPFFTLHRELNRMFDDAFRGFDLAPFGLTSWSADGPGWPQIDIDETDKELRITAELPGLDVLAHAAPPVPESPAEPSRFLTRTGAARRPRPPTR